MSAVDLDFVKRHLRVVHNLDDVLLSGYIEDAEDEARLFLDRDELPRLGVTAVDECDSNQPEPVSDADDLARSVRSAICMLVQAMYEGKDAAEMAAVRKAAEVKMMPYRNNLGV